MLDKTAEKRILEFVHQQPRTVQEVAHLIQRNWRTADSYVEKIVKESGAISTRTFRGGTRGALKIVFWNNIERINSTEFQERLFKRIEHGKRKEDFSPFELYNYIDPKMRKAWNGKYSERGMTKQHLPELLASAKRQVLIFTGNCSFINLTEDRQSLLSVFQQLAERGVGIKVLSRVDLAAVKNLQKFLSINYGLGKDVVEVKHCEQPLRGFIIDDEVVRLKEELDPVRYRSAELDGHTILLYEFSDPDWVKWLQNVFWNLFRSSLSGQKRLEDLRSIKGLR
ncbi:hypothetical protein HY493_00910 [Candidatus Woesearchaeota archaeon]|nr:hypothetical protein [Candidatus Woesearchaeota archaeon]